MANQRAAGKVLLTAWVHKDFKTAVSQPRILRGEQVENVTDLIIKLLSDCASRHGVRIPDRAGTRSRR